MIKSYLTIILLTLPCIIVQVSAKEFTESYKVKLPEGQVVKVNEGLVYLSIYGKSINVTSAEADFVPYQLNLDQHLSEPLNIDGATSLGNGKIIAWDHVYEFNWKLTHTKIFIIDPVNCTSTTITKVVEIPIGYRIKTVVVPYHDSFDMFSQGYEFSPRRFKDNGVSIDLPESIYKPVQLPVNYDYEISPIGDNATSGYLLTQRFYNCTTLLKILSPTFVVLKEQLINLKLESLSTDHGQIRICGSGCNITHYCEVLDFNLRTVKSLERIAEKDGTHISLVQNLPDRGAVVALYSERFLYEDARVGDAVHVYVRRIRADGSIDSDVKFEDFPYWNVHFQNFLLRDRRYCLAFYDVYTKEVLIKCLKYDE